MTLQKLLIFPFLLIMLALPAQAVEPDEVLKDPALETRARDLSKILRCVVCQNQSIDDSNAPLARDLRILLRERLQAGDNDDEAIDYIVARYGNFVLLKPPLQLNTLLLWFGPALILFAAIFVYWNLVRRKPGGPGGEAPPTPLSEEERKQLHDILDKDQPL